MNDRLVKAWDECPAVSNKPVNKKRASIKLVFAHVTAVVYGQIFEMALSSLMRGLC